MTRRAPMLILIAVAVGLVILHEPVPAPARRASAASFGRGPEIVLVHGLGSTSEHWLATARVLSRDHRVTLVDLPGHGQSEMPQPFSLEQAATSLDEALAVRGGEPVVLVGHSLGGLVCAAEAIAHPDRVRALVLVETALRSQVPEADRPALLQQLDTHYAELVHGAYVDFGRDSAQGEALWRDVAGLDPEMIKRWIRLAWTSDLSDRAAELRVPVLVVLAPRSWDTAESWDHVSKALGYERVQHLHAERLDRCGHFVMLDRPRGLARLIAGFAANPWTEEPQAEFSAPSRPRAARSGS